ncbi:hypothetical protein JR316_0001290 [Psilocybe cubensis]|uniref:Uncharacterized protein n=2 Tax=Psilocybe cubensis TaxID=181762 RepID=A0A8H7Y6B4_PSICU|nr:hypothetical protein JR316_0001290 [Psilocybe cubensis]KAH9487221.1 hypothetical protein JR316_0001290 [Psilocybe cubensis]
MARNAAQAKTLEKEYSNYRALESKGLKSAIVQTHGLFGAEGLPGHKFLLLENGGKTATQMTKANLKRHRKAYMSVLKRFHNAEVLIGNVEDGHILMDDCNRVTVISLSNISTDAPTKEEKREEKISFKRAISYSKEPESDSQSSDVVDLVES